MEYIRSISNLLKIVSFHRSWITSLTLVTVIHASYGARPYLGDPGALGDIGVDLNTYANQPRYDTGKMRPRRFISFPTSSTAQVSTKFTIPLFDEYDSYVKGVFKGYGIVSYSLPTEFVTLGRSLQGSDSTQVSRLSQGSSLSEERLETYSAIENAFDSVGVPGRQCLQRAICEAAENGVPSDMGLLGEVTALLLAPTHNLVNSTRVALGPYAAAQDYGADVGHCSLVYTDCPYRLPDLIAAAVSVLHADSRRGIWY